MFSSVAALKPRTAQAPPFALVEEPEAQDAALPEIVASIDPIQAAARIGIWRAATRSSRPRSRPGSRPRRAAPHGAAALVGRQSRLASVMLATAAALDPERAEIWLDLGFTLQASGETRQAMLALQRSLALDPTLARGWLALGLAANQFGDSALAEAGVRAALERDPGLGEAAFGLGLIAFDQRRYGDATQAFRRALALGAEAPLARVGLGQSLFFLGEFEAAAAEFRGAVGGDRRPESLRRAALAQYLALRIKGDYERADRGI